MSFEALSISGPYKKKEKRSAAQLALCSVRTVSPYRTYRSTKDLHTSRSRPRRAFQSFRPSHLLKSNLHEEMGSPEEASGFPAVESPGREPRIKNLKNVPNQEPVIGHIHQTPKTSNPISPPIPPPDLEKKTKKHRLSGRLSGHPVSARSTCAVRCEVWDSLRFRVRIDLLRPIQAVTGPFQAVHWLLRPFSGVRHLRCYTYCSFSYCQFCSVLGNSGGSSPPNTGDESDKSDDVGNKNPSARLLVGGIDGSVSPAFLVGNIS